jgi:hypothetical protein
VRVLVHVFMFVCVRACVCLGLCGDRIRAKNRRNCRVLHVSDYVQSGIKSVCRRIMLQSVQCALTTSLGIADFYPRFVLET